jgi:hypothetical protein
VKIDLRYNPYIRSLSRQVLLILTVLLTCCLAANAQNKTVYTKVYFAKNESGLSKRATKKLDAFCTKLDTIGEIEKVFLHGFTDSDAASDYNVKLSIDRCKTVKEYLVSAGYKHDQITIRPHGEKKAGLDANDPRKKAKNRRVDAVVSYTRITILKDTISTVVADTCDGDTLIDMGEGVFAIMSMCDYNKHKSCLTYHFYKRVQCSKYKVNRFKMKLGLKNYSKCINPFVSFEFYIESCGDTCFTVPMRVFIPTSYYKTRGAMRDFRKALDRRTRKVKYNQKEYLELEVKCGGNINCGGNRRFPCCNSGYKIKLKNKLKLIEAIGRNDRLEQETVLVFKEKRDSSNFYVKRDVIETLVLRQGDSLITISNVQLPLLRQSLRRCKTCKHRWFFFNRLYQRDKTTPKHYKIKAKDLHELISPGWRSRVEAIIEEP